MSTSLLILAFNEEKNISTLIDNFIGEFSNVIVVNDASKDKTKKILDDLSLKNEKLLIINNEKNYGAGKSFQIGVEAFLNLTSENLVKIDGDGQFEGRDILKIKELLETNNFDYVRCDRFWSGGIVGKIPNIRYLGNSLASLLIKFSTGVWNLNDPLNGLYGMKKSTLTNFQIPKMFNRYGYPYFVSNFYAYLGYTENIKIAQIKNTITYGDEDSNLNPIKMLFKLPYFVIKNFYSKIKFKLRFSSLQVSGLLEMISNIFLFSSLFSIFRFIQIRYFQSLGPQGSWFILFIIFIVLFFLLNISSQSRLNKLSEEFFEEI